MTINDFKKTSVELLSAISNNAKFEIDQIIMHFLKINKNDLLLKAYEDIDESLLEKLQNALIKRLDREPLQYILGEWEFYGLRFFCGKGCLIPRIETETLVDMAIELMPKNSKLLDLCTGSGCICISVLNNRPDVSGTAVDISSEALKFAQRNASYHHMDTRIKFVCEDIKYYVPEEAYDVIVSNPPYIKSNDIMSLSPEVKKEPEIALDGGEDGLDFYKVISKRYYGYLRQGGYVLLETGYDIAQDVAEVFEKQGYETCVINDTFENERVCIAKKI